MASRQNTYIISAAVIIAVLLIVFGIFAGGGSKTEDNGDTTFSPITDQDWIRGTTTADIIIVEYSDLECPFCKSFHATMQKIIEDNDETEVSWVYRHFPLDSIHPKARREAHAAECAGEIGGNDAFWSYVDRIYEITPSNNNLDLDELPVIAEEIGLDQEAFSACQNENRHGDKVDEDARSAVDAGGRGTPYLVFVTKAGGSYTIGGALSEVKAQEIIDTIREDLDNGIDQETTGQKVTNLLSS